MQKKVSKVCLILMTILDHSTWANFTWTRLTDPYLINTIEIRSLWTETKYIKSAGRLLDRVWVNKGGLDLSKEVLWVSVGQRAAELPAIKVGGQKIILPNGPAWAKRVRTGPLGRIFVDLQLWQPVDLLPFDLKRPTVPF